MKDKSKTKQVLIDELVSLRHRIVELERSEEERKRAEEELRKSERAIHDLYDNSPCGYHSLDKDGLIIRINDTELNWLGYSRDEVIGKMKLSDLLTSKSAEDFKKNFALFKERGWTQDLEYELVRKDGTILPVLLSATVVKDIDGNYMMSRSILYDIAQHKKMEEALQESEERFRRLADATWEGIIIHREGIIIDANEAALKMIGYPAEEVIGQIVLMFLAPESIEPALQKLKESMDTPQLYLEAKGLRKDKTVFPIEVLGRPIRYKNFDARVLAIRDLTERKRAAEALGESEEKYRAIIENMQEGYHEVDIKGNFTFLNESICEVLGYEREELLGMNYRQYSDEENARKIYQVYNRVYRTGEPEKNFEWQVIRKDGERRDIEASISLLRDAEAHPTGFRGIVRDITERKRAEQELISTKARMDALLASAPVMIYSCKTYGDFGATFISENIKDYLGYQAHEFITSSGFWANHIHPDDAPRVIAGISSVFEKGHHSHEYRFQHKNGEYRWMHDQLTLVRDKSGEPVEMIGAWIDITERKRMEEALLQNETRYRHLVESSHDWIWEVNQDGVYTYASPQVLDVLGYTPEEVIGKTPFDLMPEDEAERVRHVFSSITAQRQPFRGLENLNRHKDGRLVILETNGVPIIDDQGSFLGYRGMDRDITERKKAEEAIRESENKYNELAHFLPQIVFETDMKGNITFVNHAAYPLSGYSPEEFKKGLNVLQILVPEDRDRARLNMQRIMQGEELRGNEYTFLRKDGRTFPVITETVPIVRNNQTLGLRGLVIDITERRQLESQLFHTRKMESLGQLASGAAHEIRNPLNIMSLRMQMLDVTGKAVDEDTRKVIDTCHAQINRITQVLEGLDEFSQMPEIRKTQNDLNKIIEEVVASQDKRFKDEGITPEIRYGEDIPSFMFDKEKIATVITHLISNAVDAMRGRDARNLNLSTEKISAEDKAEESVRIIISDTGHGIKEADKTRIFDPFFTTKDPDKGKGLGLSVSYGIIRDHGGTIRAENNAEGGATFFIDLPVGRGSVS